MHHEIPANMPLMLKHITGEENVQMVGAEGVLAGGLDKLVTELQGEEFEVGVSASFRERTFLTVYTH